MKYIFIITINALNFFYLNAQQGTLDYNFGDSGKVAFYTNGTSNAVGVLSTGKIVTAGNGKADDDFGYELISYNSDGSFNEAFGKNGFSILNYAGLTNAESYTLSVLPGDFILSAGYFYSEEHSNLDVLLVKQKSNGSIDSTFGINGIVVTDFGESEFIKAMQVQADGKIVVAGESEDYPHKTMFVARYSEQGILDESFGDKGKVLINSGETANSVALQKDGKIVVGGLHFDGDNSFLLVRLNSDGSYDKSFGNNGIVITDFSTQDEYINSVAIQPDGKILAAGVSGVFVFNSKDIMSVARYDEQGNLDNSFGKEGKATVKFSSLSEAITVLLQNDGKIILSGETRKNNEIFNTALCRLNDNGNLDSSFGTNGLSETDFGGSENVTSAVIQKDGKIIIAGNSYINNGYYDILARYNNDDKNQKQILITKIKRWLQHHNGFTWDANSNVTSYVVQRSYDGIHFSSIAKINTGNSSNTFADPAPLSSNNYYRLQTTSVNGAVNYSNVIAVTANDNDVTISPNPAKNNLQIQGLTLSDKTKLTVVDFSGNIKLSATVNNTSYNLNITSLKPGNYLLKIETNGVVITRKFVKE